MKKWRVFVCMLLWVGCALLSFRAAGSALQFYGTTGSGGTYDFSLVELDPSTGAVTLLLDGRFWTGLDFSPDGNTLYAVSSTLYKIDLSVPAYAAIGPLTYQGSAAILMRSMTISPTGEMYVLSSSSDPAGEPQFYRVDLETGELELVGPAEGFVWAIEFASDGTLYAAEFDLMTIDPADGSTLTTIGPLDSGLLINELDFSQDGRLYGTDSDEGLYEIDLGTGQATLLTTYPTDEIRSVATGRSFRFEVQNISGNPPFISWNSLSGKDYKIWLSEDLFTWVAKEGVITGSDTGVSNWTDDGQHDLGSSSEARRRFYRVEQVQAGR